MEPYVYQDLPDSEHIRLLTVQALGDDTDDIRCSMHPVLKSAEDDYTALSYSWAMDDGDASKSRSITVDGKAVAVTRNLFEGLQRIFAGSQQRRPIWIDAVCINQVNTEERNSQVSRMGKIYSNAADVVCWLGNGCNELDTANVATVVECFSCARHSNFREHELRGEDGRVLNTCIAGAAYCAVKTLCRAGERSDGDMAARILPLFDIDELELVTKAVRLALKNFFSRRYWSRRWIVQEVCQVRPQVSFQLANRRFSQQKIEILTDHISGLAFRSSVSNFFEFDFDERGEDPYLFRDYSRVRSLLDLRRQFHSVKLRGMSLANSLLACHGFACSDARDVVFSLVSLDLATTVKVDYNMSVGQTYTAFIVDLLGTASTEESYTGFTGVLNCAAITRTIGYRKGYIPDDMPSWVPDLRLRAYMGALPALASWRLDPSNRLMCSALIVGTISEDLKSVEYSRRGSAAVADNSEPATIISRYTITQKWNRFKQAHLCHGDMVCIFDDIDGRINTSGDNFAIVLRSTDAIDNGYRITSCLEFKPTEWTPGTHPVRAVCIL